jgi:hypothetical protein
VSFSRALSSPALLKLAPPPTLEFDGPVPIAQSFLYTPVFNAAAEASQKRPEVAESYLELEKLHRHVSKARN